MGLLELFLKLTILENKKIISVLYKQLLDIKGKNTMYVEENGKKN